MEKRILTPEVKKALMSKAPFSKDATSEYTPKAYLDKVEGTEEYTIPEEFRPVFTIRPYTKYEAGEVKKACVKANDVVIREWSRKSCVNAINLFDAGSGEELEFKLDADGGADKDLWSLLPDHICADILMYASCLSGILDKDKVGL